jgi:hypothetical protein
MKCAFCDERSGLQSIGSLLISLREAVLGQIFGLILRRRNLYV